VSWYSPHGGVVASEGLEQHLLEPNDAVSLCDRQPQPVQLGQAWTLASASRAFGAEQLAEVLRECAQHLLALSSRDVVAQDAAGGAGGN